MNYYERHLGDYARDTAHLSMLEHGAYGLLLDRYYATEAGIPADQAHRLARAKSAAERAAVDAVLAEFFVLADGVWINSRAAREVAKARTKIEAARNNGKSGGRPKKNPEEAQQKPTGLSLGSETGTQTKALQSPDTRHQEKTNTEPTVLVVSPSAPRLPACPADEIVNLYHEHLPMLPRVEILSDGRRRALSARWRDVVSDPAMKGKDDIRREGLDWFAWYFGHAASSKFLTGKSKDWRADFDFLVTPQKFVKVCEGHYHKEAA